MNYLLINIKRLFLSFAQSYYSTQTKYKWTQDPRTTKIFISDKYAFDPSIVEKGPSIVLSRGAIQWENIAIDQRVSHKLDTGSKVRSDLIRGNITFSCIAKSGIEAEFIADTLFYLLVGYKDEFKKRGIFSLKPVMIGEEQLIRSDSSPRAFMIPVQVGFEMQYTIDYAVDAYGGAIIVDNLEETYLQQIDFDFTSASGLSFYTAPDTGLTLTLTYLDAITLLEDTQPLIGAVNGINTEFTLTNAVSAIYPILQHIEPTYVASGLF